MKKEIYFWIGLFVAVLAVALYVRFFYTSPIGVTVNFVQSPQSVGTLYPFQKLYLNVTVNNTGSTAISDMGIGVLLNGNTTYVYGVTIPAGEGAVLDFNYTPTKAGTYNFTVVADPNKLYNIANRNKATSTFVVNVPKPQAAAYSLLPANGVVSETQAAMGTPGFVYYSDLGIGYNLSHFKTLTLPGFSSFFTTLFEVTGNYMENINIATAQYSDGNSVDSLWLQSYLSPEVVAVAAKGLDLNTSSYSLNGQTVTVVNLSDNESLCSWYAGGWIKMLASQGSGTCVALVSGSGATLSPIEASNSVHLEFNSNVSIANYSQTSQNGTFVGYSASPGGVVFVTAGLTTNSPTGKVCYGVITSLNNTDYCSTFIDTKNESIGSVSLIRTSTMVNSYNLSVFSLGNTSDAIQQIPVNIGIMAGFNLTGPPVSYISGIRNYCLLGGNLECENATFNNSIISFNVINNGTIPVKITALACGLYGAPEYTVLNYTLAPNSPLTLSSGCYNEGSLEASLPYGLLFNLWLNYTSAAKAENITGSAYVIG